MAQQCAMRKLIAAIRALLLLPFMAAALPAFADPYVDNAAIDALFRELRVAHSDRKAAEISNKIWRYWTSPSDPTLATHMSVANNLVGEGLIDAAIDELTIVVTEYPDYAEGWNQRATVHYMLGNFDASLSDIDKVLAIEPRHYGALAGRVLIYLRQGKHSEALRDMVAALAIHPYLSERRLFPELAKDITHV